MTCQDTVTVRRADGSEEDVPLDDLFDPLIPPEFEDPAEPGGDPASIENISAGTFQSSAPADGSTAITVLVKIEDNQFLGVEGETVNVADDAGLSMPASAVTDAFGEAEFAVTSTNIGTFQIFFSHPDAGTASTEITFEDPDAFSAGGDNNFGDDISDQQAVQTALTLIQEIRDLLNAVPVQNYAIISSSDVSRVQARVDDCEDHLELFGAGGQLGASFDGRVAINLAIDIGRGRERFMRDAQFDPTAIDAKITELIEVLIQAFGGESSFSAGTRFSEALGETDAPAVWQEKSRETSTVTIEGVEIERIDTITFTVPGNREVKLELNNPAPE